MRRIISNPLVEPLVVFFITLTAMFFASPLFTSQYLYRPRAGTVFVGMTAYFEDFYYYLDQFYQGAHGSWLTINHFSIEHYPPTLIYFINIMFGKIGGLLRFESFQSFNYFGLLFKFLFMISAYVLIRRFFHASFFQRVSVYLIFLFSNSLPKSIMIRNGSLILDDAVDLFRTGNRFLSRFGTSASGMFTNVLFIMLLLILLRFFSREWVSVKQHVSEEHEPDVHWVRIVKTFIVILPAFILMTLSDPVVALVLLGIFTILYVKYSIEKKSFRALPDTNVLITALFVIFFVLFFYIERTVNADPVYRQSVQWDNFQYLQQIKAVGIVNFIEGGGLLAPLFFYGYWLLVHKQHKNIFEDVVLIMTAIGVLGYIIPLLLQIPVPAFRFMFPAMYVPIAIIAWYAFGGISRKFRKTNMRVVLLAVYIAISFICIFPRWYDSFKPLQEPNFHFAYIPDELYQGLIFLRSAKPLDGNVLSSSYTSTDLMIPGIAGRYTYSGHFLTTYNSQQKDKLNYKFFYDGMDQLESREFLKKNRIRFIVVTKYAAVLESIKTRYPFLEIVFQNPTVTIFRFDPA